MGAEILVATYSADSEALISGRLPLIRQSWIPHRLYLATDSYGLYGTVTSLRESKDYRLRPTVAAIRDTYECGEIEHLLWVPGSVNIADPLTKYNRHIRDLLMYVLQTGRIPTELLSHATVILKPRPSPSF